MTAVGIDVGKANLEVIVHGDAKVQPLRTAALASDSWCAAKGMALRDPMISPRLEP